MRPSTKILLFAIMLLLCISAANAISIGISPGRVRFEDVLRDGYSQRIVTISTSSDEELVASFRVDGEMKDWVSFSPNAATFSFSRDNPYRLTIIVQPPPDIRIGNYSGNIEFITEAVGGTAGRAGAQVKTAVILLMNLQLTGAEIIQCRAGAFSFNDAEIGFPFEFSYNVINDGNVRIRPTLAIDVWDQNQKELLLTREIRGEEALPTTERKIKGTLANTLAEGQYWLSMEAKECKTSNFLTFSVVEKGGIIDKGDLVEISNKPWGYTNETIQITAKFRNVGMRSVTAKFKGEIRLDDRIVRLIDTDEVIVPAGESADFDVFFVPGEPGRYTISGRVLYNKKLTYEKGSILNINESEIQQMKRFSFIALFIYIAIITTIIFLLRKIIRERRKNRRF